MVKNRKRLSWWALGGLCAALVALAACGQQQATPDDAQAADAAAMLDSGDSGDDGGGGGDSASGADSSGNADSSGSTDSGGGAGDATDPDGAGAADASGTDVGSGGDSTVDGSGDGTAPPLTACQSTGDCLAALPACQGWTCQSGACVAVAIGNGAACDDGNACTLGDQCTAGLCAGASQKLCDDANPCTADGCDAQTGACASAPLDATPCDDGLACSVGDSCKGGKCTPAKSFCDCLQDADCPDDANACNGTPFCDKASANWQCKVKPGSAVVCPPASGPCVVAVCEAGSGQCQPAAKPEGTACSDGDPCSVGDTCAAGQCKAGLETCICKSQADCGALEDGDLCNGTLYCDMADHTCKVNPKTQVQCSGANDSACLKNSCDAKVGKCAMQPVKDGASCDDGNACTAGDHCQAGTCAKAADVCSCTTDSECAAKDDKDLCNGSLYCDKAVGVCKVNPATVVYCPSLPGEPCLTNACQKTTGTCEAVALPDGATCDADGNACTPADSCSKGACVADENTCDCQTTFDCKAKEDGDLCNGQLYCDKTVAKCKLNPATVVICPYAKDTACLQNTCDASTGQCFYKPVREGLDCDADGNPCSPQDSCVQGNCVAGALTCDCQSNADCAAKEDGDLCNGTLYCDKGKCVVNPATVVQCADLGSGPCAKNLCQPKTGKCKISPIFQYKPCDADGNPCTLYDTCLNGICKVSANLCACKVDGHCSEVEDGNFCNGTLSCDASAGSCAIAANTAVTCPKPGGPCLVSSCQPATGNCLQSNGPNGSSCDDEDFCTSKDSCSQGSCKGAPLAKALCDDANPCTDDSCDPKKGCVQLANSATCSDDGSACTQDVCKDGSCSHPAVTSPVLCDDGNPCTAKDGCNSGNCLGVKAICDDGNPCTTDVCLAKLGCVFEPLAGTCDDGDACTVGETCQASACKGGQPKLCSDGTVCTTDSCDKLKGCSWTAVSGACTDGEVCTQGDACQGGKCLGSKVICDDGKDCTVDSCASGLGCVATPLPGCSLVLGLPWLEPFDCGKDGAWTLDPAAAGPNWAVDATPGQPAPKSAGCTLNFNDGTSYGCAAGKPLQAMATSAWIDAKAMPVGGGLQLTYQLAGSWEAGPSDNLLLEATSDGVTWQKLQDLDGPGNTWKGGTVDLKAYAGKPFRLRWQFNTTDCLKNDTSGPFIDDLQVAAIGCLKDSDCQDQLPCTADTCTLATGTCVNKLTNVLGACSDGNPCTADSCDVTLTSPTAGQCLFKNDDAPICDDGQPCTSADKCGGGLCSGSAKCNDGDACTADQCDTKTGNCTFAPKVCNDNAVCTSDSCDKVSGACTFSANTGSCDDGNACTSGDSCAAGLCAGKPKCDDGQACTTDSCSGGTCVYAPKPCSDGTPCTTDACDSKTGQCVFTPDDLAKPAAATCSQANDCRASVSACSGGKEVCLAGDPLPAKEGGTCSGATGLCAAGTCIPGPVLVSASTGGPQKTASTVQLTVTVTDGDNDAAASKSDIASVTVDLQTVGGSAKAALTQGAATGTAQTWQLSLAAGPTPGLYALPLTVTDKGGQIAKGYAVLQLYSGTLRTVGSGGTHPTLAAGLQASSDGDGILLLEGTYSGAGNIGVDLPAKQVQIGSKAGAGKVIFDCKGEKTFASATDVGSALGLGLAGMTVQGCSGGALRVTASAGKAAGLSVGDAVLQGHAGTAVTALYVSGSSAEARIVASRITGNDGTQAAMFVDKGALTVLGVGVVDNKGKSGIHALAAQLTLRDLRFSNPLSSQFNGSALLQVGGSLDARGLTLVNQARAIRLEDGTFAIDGLVSVGNLVAFFVVGQTSTVTATNLLFDGGTSPSSLSGAQISISHSKWLGGKGPALTTNGAAALSQLEFAHFTFQVNDGGCAVGLDWSGVTPPKVTLKDSLVRNTTGFAAPVCLGNVEAVVQGCSFKDNVATGNSGALVSSATTTVRDCTFLSNSSSNAKGAGALYLHQPNYLSGLPTVENCLFYGNKGGQGGAIAVAMEAGAVPQVPVLRGLTLANNQASGPGGGLYVNTKAIKLEHSILWGNSDGASGSDAGDQAYFASLAGASHSVQWTLCSPAEGQFGDPGLLVNGGAGFVPGQLGNRQGDPQFVSGPKGSYYLAHQATGQAANSPAVDPLGGALAASASWGARTTRSDGAPDSGALDLGWHYAP